MQKIKIIFLISILFSFSQCINEVKNTFTPSSKICVNQEDYSFLGQWEKTDESDIPERLIFSLMMLNNEETKCSISKEERDKFRCLKEKTPSAFSQTYMDSNHEYILQAMNGIDLRFNCKENLINAFIPSGKIYTNEENFSILGNWKKTSEGTIPENLDFDLIFDDYNKTRCQFSKKKIDEIKCNGNYYSQFFQQFMDTNQEYMLKGLESFSPEPYPDPTPDTTDPTPDTTDPTPVPATSSFLYFNLLTLFAIIFILF